MTWDLKGVRTGSSTFKIAVLLAVIVLLVPGIGLAYTAQYNDVTVAEKPGHAEYGVTTADPVLFKYGVSQGTIEFEDTTFSSQLSEAGGGYSLVLSAPGASFTIKGETYTATASGSTLTSLSRGSDPVEVASNTFSVDGTIFTATCQNGSVTSIGTPLNDVVTEDDVKMGTVVLSPRAYAVYFDSSGVIDKAELAGIERNTDVFDEAEVIHYVAHECPEGSRAAIEIYFYGIERQSSTTTLTVRLDFMVEATERSGIIAIDPAQTEGETVMSENVSLGIRQVTKEGNSITFTGFDEGAELTLMDITDPTHYFNATVDSEGECTFENVNVGMYRLIRSAYIERTVSVKEASEVTQVNGILLPANIFWAVDSDNNEYFDLEFNYKFSAPVDMGSPEMKLRIDHVDPGDVQDKDERTSTVRIIDMGNLIYMYSGYVSLSGNDGNESQVHTLTFGNMRYLGYVQHETRSAYVLEYTGEVVLGSYDVTLGNRFMEQFSANVHTVMVRNGQETVIIIKLDDESFDGSMYSGMADPEGNGVVITGVAEASGAGIDGKVLLLPEYVAIFDDGLYALPSEKAAYAQTVVAIGDGTNAVSGIGTVESLFIPEGVTTINDNAFASLTNLHSVRIPSTVTDVGDNVFQGCTTLYSVTVMGDEPSDEPWDRSALGLDSTFSWTHPSATVCKGTWFSNTHFQEVEFS